MNLIICHPHDSQAIWVHTQLKRYQVPSTLLTVEELLMAKKWSQSIDNEQDSFEIETSSGLKLTDKNINFVLNRALYAQSPIWQKAKMEEQNYISAEMTALIYSWLHQVTRKTKLFNPPNGYSFSGLQIEASEWAFYAQKAGFDIDSDLKTTKKVLVIAEKVIGKIISKSLAEKCINFSKLINAPIVEIELGPNNEFVTANTQPNFSNYGKNFIERLIYQIHWKS